MAKGTCSIDGCDRPAWARGWCHSHYDRWRRGGDPARALKKPQATASTHNIGDQRACTCCGIAKPLTEYYSSPSRPYEPRCRGCHRARKRRYRALYPDRQQAANRVWYLKNREHAIARAASWAEDHPERAAKNRRRIALRRYYRKMANWIEDVDRDLVYERDGGACQLCGAPADPECFHIDHVIPVSKGGEHSYANVQLAHPLCNQRKSARLGVLETPG